MSSEDLQEKECPLCMEPLEIDDIDFYPCKCEYQICRFCWHRIRTNENGLCPACRQPYPEDPVNFKPLTVSDVQKIKTEKKQKQQQQRLKISESRQHLSSYRVLQKNLVYVVGLSSRVADPDILKKSEFFGKYGRILKIVVGSSPVTTASQSASSTAYVTYFRYEDALRAIQAVNNAQLDGRIVRASLGTTKYCSSFLRSQPCHKPECMYLHDVADSEVSFTKDDMHQGRHAEYEKKLIEMTLFKDKYPRGCENSSSNISRRIYSHVKDENHDKKWILKSTISNGLEKGYGSVGSSLPSHLISDKEHNDKNLVPSDRTSQRNTDSENSTGSKSPVHNIRCRSYSNKSNVGYELSKRGCDTEQQHAVRYFDLSSFCSMSQQKTNPNQHQHESDVPSYSGSRLLQWTSFGNASLSRKAPMKCTAVEPLVLNSNDRFGKRESTFKEKSLRNLSASPDWQRALGLSPNSLANQQADTHCESISPSLTSQSHFQRPSRLSVHSDDDLGFDPFSESAKGLADLLEEEKTASPPQLTKSSSSVSSLTSSLVSLGLQCGWPSVARTRGGCLPLPDSLSSEIQHNCAPCLNSHQNGYTSSSSLATPTTDILNCSSQVPFLNNDRMSLSHSQSTPNYYSPHPSQSTRSEVLRYHVGNHSYLDLPPGLCSQQRFSPVGLDASVSPNPVIRTDTGRLNEWQEGFKALLPNVNVRFVSEFSATGYTSSRPLAPLVTQPSSVISSCGNCYGQPPAVGGLYDQTGPRSLLVVTHAEPPGMQWMSPPPGFHQTSKR